MPPFIVIARLAALAAAGATLAAGTSPAWAGHAAGGDPDAWHAQFVRKSPDLRLESGQEATSWFEARNISDNVTWDNDVVKLGTDEPYDRASPMYWDQDWAAAHRATHMDEETVGPNAVGRFTFRVKAPTVNRTTTHRECMAPVAEAVAWMDTAEWAAQGCRAIDYVITPPVPPTVSLTNAPTRLRRGEVLRVEIRARDDYEIGGVRLAVGDLATEAISTVPDVYTAELPTDGLAPGVHTLTVTGRDHVDNQTTARHQFEVFEPPPPQLDASVVMKGRVIRGARGVRVRGLTITAPIGSRISVSCRPRRCRNLVIGATTRTTNQMVGMRGRRLRRGTQVYVRVTKPGMVGELTLLTIGRRNIVSNAFPIPLG